MINFQISTKLFPAGRGVESNTNKMNRIFLAGGVSLIAYWIWANNNNDTTNNTNAQVNLNLLTQANNGGYVIQNGIAIPVSVINQQTNLNLSATQAQNLLAGNTQFQTLISETITTTATNSPNLVTQVDNQNFF